jgi:hypothetical protein
MAGPDFYKILGVSASATADEIKAAHRELVKIFHPDLFPAGAEKTRANRRLQQINEAYATLSNPERRQQYDARRVQAASPAKRTVPPAKKKTAPSKSPRPATATWKSLLKLAQEKLHQIHEAYRTLAEAERRRKRSARISRRADTGKHTSATAKNKSTSSASFPWIEYWAGRLRDLGPVKATTGIIGIAAVALVLHALWDEAETAIAWTLLESTSVESSQHSAGTRSAERNWVRLGSYSSKTQCVSSLKEAVAMDERAGGKVFLDERSGTIAMAIYMTSEAALAEEYLHAKLKRTTPDAVDQQALEQEAREEAKEFVRKNGLSQRVKNYQCREIPVIQPESWLRRKLRQLGLVS